MNGFIYIAGVILLSAYAQIMGKWRINDLGWVLPEGALWVKGWAYIKLLFDPYMLTCAIAASAASFCWNMAMSKMNITAVLPFTSATPIVVFLLGVMVLNEQFSMGKLIGLVLVVAGVIIAARY